MNILTELFLNHSITYVYLQLISFSNITCPVSVAIRVSF